MWFPNKKKVAARLSELILIFRGLKTRTSEWNGTLNHLVSSGFVGYENEMLPWTVDSMGAQEGLLRVMEKMCSDLGDGTCQWQDVYPMMAEAELAAKSTKLILDNLDKSASASRKRTQALLGIGGD